MIEQASIAALVRVAMRQGITGKVLPAPALAVTQIAANILFRMRLDSRCVGSGDSGNSENSGKSGKPRLSP